MIKKIRILSAVSVLYLLFSFSKKAVFDTVKIYDVSGSGSSKSEFYFKMITNELVRIKSVDPENYSYISDRIDIIAKSNIKKDFIFYSAYKILLIRSESIEKDPNFITNIFEKFYI